MQLEYKWQALAIVCIGIFMSTLDGSILNIANPVIARSLQVSIPKIQWIVTAYMLVITSSLLFFGHLGDKIGSERIFTLGFIIFAAGSFFCSIAGSLPFLICARIIQAFGASMMMSTGIGIVSNTFPPGERGKALGLTGSVVGIGNMAGPALGGLLVGHFNWNVIFWLNIPIGIVGFVLALKCFNRSIKGAKEQRYDIIGTILFALFTVALILSLVGSAGIRIWLLGISLVLLLGFMGWERKTAFPLLDFSLLAVPKFVQGNVMGMAAYTSQTLVFFLLPFYMDGIMGLSPAQAGFLMAISPVMMMLFAPVAGFLSDRLGSSRLTATAFTLMIMAYVLISVADINSGPVPVAVGLVILGAGMACFGSPNSSSILGAVPAEKAGYSGGFISTVRNLSYCLGTAASAGIFTWLLNAQIPRVSYVSAYINAAHFIFGLGAAMACTGLLISLRALILQRK